MISEQQQKILAFQYTNYDALICDGAVRSGKTSIEMYAFVKWAMLTFNNQHFAVCGKTVDSAIKNVVQPFRRMTLAKEHYKIEWRRADHILTVKTNDRENTFEVFGGKDESSQDLIQGRTLAGVFLDEVALMPESFFNQALARCSVEGARFWFSCNPSNPKHWFYTSWIQQSEKFNALYLHFTMKDNPSLSESTLRRYENMYSGVFYQRYILGKWVSADGLVYDMFDEKIHVVPTGSLETEGEYYVSSDYGIQNATVFILWQKEKGTNRWVAIREYYYSGRENKVQKTVSELVDGLIDILPMTEDGMAIAPKQIIVDPSASALIAELRKRKLHVIHAKNDVLNGIADVSTMLRQGLLVFYDCCTGTIKEFGIYAWDAKASDRGEDKPLKVDDHGMDTVRYFVFTKHLVKRSKE